MLLSTDGLPGPVMVKRFGKPADGDAEVGARPGRPLVARAYAAAGPVMSGRSSGPVMASNPVAKTMRVERRTRRSVVRRPGRRDRDDGRGAHVDQA